MWEVLPKSAPTPLSREFWREFESYQQSAPSLPPVSQSVVPRPSAPPQHLLHRPHTCTFVAHEHALGPADAMQHSRRMGAWEVVLLGMDVYMCGRVCRRWGCHVKILLGKNKHERCRISKFSTHPPHRGDLHYLHDPTPSTTPHLQVILPARYARFRRRSRACFPPAGAARPSARGDGRGPLGYQPVLPERSTQVGQPEGSIGRAARGLN